MFAAGTPLLVGYWAYSLHAFLRYAAYTNIFIRHMGIHSRKRKINDIKLLTTGKPTQLILESIV